MNEWWIVDDCILSSIYKGNKDTYPCQSYSYLKHNFGGDVDGDVGDVDDGHNNNICDSDSNNKKLKYYNDKISNTYFLHICYRYSHLACQKGSDFRYKLAKQIVN